MKRTYTKELILSVLDESKSWAEVCRSLGIKASTGGQSYLQKRAKEFGIETPSHFLGKSSRKGIKSSLRKDAITYCKKGLIINSHRLKEYLIRDKYKEPKCEKCGIIEWQGEPVVLELDHIDNDHTNNNFQNLQILCPNCHALKTRKNIKNKKPL
jgi:Zn finger protein HypA/HybF involved in hydrogenase expression